MSDGFTKLYGDRLLNSSIWLESIEVRCLWFFFLAKADADGVVDIPSVKVLAHVANMPLDAVQRALVVLESPDEDSRTPDEGGRRVIREGSVWRIVTHSKYREIRTAHQVAEAARKKAERDEERRQRAADQEASKLKGRVPDNQDASGVSRIRRIDAEAEADAEREAEKNRSAQERGSESARTGDPELTNVAADLVSENTQSDLDALDRADRAFREARKAVRMGFSARWEAAKQPGLWPASGSPAVDDLARWVVSLGDDRLALLSRTLDTFFADPWCRRDGFSVAHLSRYSAKYLLNTPREDRAPPGRGNRMVMATATTHADFADAAPLDEQLKKFGEKTK